MSSSLKKYFDYLDKISELINQVSHALQNYIAARTAIRDYVINADEKHYAEVKERISEALSALQAAEPIVEEETLDNIRGFLDVIRKWGDIARDVHDGFASYREIIQTKILPNFSAVTQAGNALLQSAPASTIGIVNDVQTANVAVMGYLFDGDPNVAEAANQAFRSAKTKIGALKKSDKKLTAALKPFAAGLDAYAAGFLDAVKSRNKAYKMFREDLAPFGAEIQEDFEDFHAWLADMQKGIKDLKVLADHGKRGIPQVH